MALTIRINFALGYDDSATVLTFDSLVGVTITKVFLCPSGEKILIAIIAGVVATVIRGWGGTTPAAIDDNDELTDTEEDEASPVVFGTFASNVEAVTFVSTADMACGDVYTTGSDEIIVVAHIVSATVAYIARAHRSTSAATLTNGETFTEIAPTALIEDDLDTASNFTVVEKANTSTDFASVSGEVSASGSSDFWYSALWRSALQIPESWEEMSLCFEFLNDGVANSADKITVGMGYDDPPVGSPAEGTSPNMLVLQIPPVTGGQRIVAIGRKGGSQTFYSNMDPTTSWTSFDAWNKVFVSLTKSNDRVQLTAWVENCDKVTTMREELTTDLNEGAGYPVLQLSGRVSSMVLRARDYKLRYWASGGGGSSGGGTDECSALDLCMGMGL